MLYFICNVIQSEAKNLNTSTLCIQILPPFGRLDDKGVGISKAMYLPSTSNYCYHLPEHLAE